MRTELIGTQNINQPIEHKYEVNLIFNSIFAFINLEYYDRKHLT
jgi:hypothetical protein